jgi:hypothetical protein
MAKEIKPVSPLEDRKVVIKVVEERGNKFLDTINKDHDGKFRFTNCIETIVLRVKKWRHEPDKVLTVGEQAYIEQELGMDEGTLSLKRATDNWWYNYRVELSKEDMVLNLNDIWDVIKYRVIRSQPFVAPSYDDRLQHSDYRYYIDEIGYTDVRAAQIADVKSEAHVLLAPIKNNKSNMIDLFRLMGIPVDANNNTQTLYGRLATMIDIVDKRERHNVYTLVEHLKDPEREKKIFLINAQAVEEIVVRGETIYIKETSESITPKSTFFERITDKKDPMYMWYQTVKRKIDSNK